jgi:hypothetical protein
MEMPIAATITLFIAVVVAGLIIAFSQDTVLKAKETLVNLWNKNDDVKTEDKIIEVESINAQGVKNLAVQCAKDVPNALEETLCFVVKSGSFANIGTINGETISVDERKLTIKVSVGSNYNSIFIYYNPLGSIDIKS